MANVLIANFLFTNAGVAIANATVDLLTRNTTTPVLATTTTDANGYWAFSYATEGRYDVRITNGSSVRWHMYDASAQFTALEVQTLRVRNPAFTFDYDIVPAAITADRQLNLPLITGTDTLASLGLAQTFTAIKTFSADVTLLDGAIMISQEPDWLSLGATSPRGYELIDSHNDLVNNTATTFITVTVTNLNHDALFIVEYVVTDASQTKALAGAVYFAITRKPGENTGLSAVTAGLTQVAADSTTPVTMTATFANSALTGAVGATQTFGVQVTANDVTNGTPPDIRYRARLLTGVGGDDSAPGITMAAA